MADDPVFPHFKGLASFANPNSFDEYIDDVTRYLERLPVVVETYVSSQAAYELFLRGLFAVPATEHSIWLWLNLIANAVREKMSFAVVPSANVPRHQVAYVKMLTAYPAETVAVCLCLAAMRAELNVPMHYCQISMDNVLSLIERLGSDESLWMFDQEDLLGECGRLAYSD